MRVAVAAIVSLLVPVSVAFVAPRSTTAGTSTELMGILGRFRKKRVVEQVKTIRSGDKLPEGDIEVLKQGDLEGSVDCSAVSVGELLGSGKTLLVGRFYASSACCSRIVLSVFAASCSSGISSDLLRRLSYRNAWSLYSNL